MICCICDKEIKADANGWDRGHNAQPVEDGRCCDDCNAQIVIPMRMREMVVSSVRKIVSRD